jgi:putative CocE/NonD family hydrolase
MLGDSYLGFTQWAAAAAAHPWLNAIAPRVASEQVPDAWFAADVASLAGVDWLARWWSGPGMVAGDILDLTARPLIDAIPADLRDARTLHREFLSLERDELHAAIYPGALPARGLRVPALHTGAWFDVMTPYQLRDWATVTAHAPAAAHQHLVMGAADHDGNPYNIATADRHLDRACDFFDLHVRGAERAPLPRVRYELAGGGWHTAPSWPPPEARPLSLALTASGALAPRADAAASTLAWTHDPLAPVPSLHADDNIMLATGALPDEAAVHAREDVLTFDAEPVTEPLTLAGPATLTAQATSSAPSAHLVATLCDVGPDGRATQITEGIAWLGGEDITLRLADSAYVLPAGHRLRLALSGSRFPRWVAHPGVGGNLWTTEERRAARQSVAVGGARPATLTLSVLPGQAA